MDNPAHLTTTGDSATAAAAAVLIEQRIPFGCYAIDGPTGNRWRFAFPAGRGAAAAIAVVVRDLVALERRGLDVNNPPPAAPAAYGPIPAWIPGVITGRRRRRTRDPRAARPHDDG